MSPTGTTTAGARRAILRRSASAPAVSSSRASASAAATDAELAPQRQAPREPQDLRELDTRVTPEDRNAARRDHEAAGEPDDGDLDALDPSDVQFNVLCRDPTQIAAARVFARTLARAVNGYFSDPQAGAFERLG